MNCPRCGYRLRTVLFGLPGPPCCVSCFWPDIEPSPAQHEVRAAGGAPLPGLEDDES